MDNNSENYSNPFPGLKPFTYEDSYLFFGREGQSDGILELLGNRRFAAVVGTSGSGKSSLVNAGVLSSIYGGYVPNANPNWRVAKFRPANDPIGEMAQALNHPEVFGSAEEVDLELQTSITEVTLRSSSLGLVEIVQQARMMEDENLLVIVDQFEELFRYKETAVQDRSGDESAAFVKLLLEAIGQNEVPIYIILTMRSDFLGDCAQFQGLPEAINKSQYLIPRMTRNQRKKAIKGPVGVGGAQITPRLVQRLLNDVGDNPDQLPILQHALMRVWEHWAESKQGDQPLDMEDYRATGGMAAALSNHADSVLDELENERIREIAKKLFKRITEMESSDRGIRRPTTLSDICAVAEANENEVIAVIEKFRDPSCSFLVPPAGVSLNPDSVIDISHESLIRVWGKLNEWAEEEAESVQRYRRLVETFELYQIDKAKLIENPELQITLDWRDENQPNQAWAQRYGSSYEGAIQFLNASQKKERKRKLIRRSIIGLPLVIGAFFLLYYLIIQVAVTNLNTQAAKTAQADANLEAQAAEKTQVSAEGTTTSIAQFAQGTQVALKEISVQATQTAQAAATTQAIQDEYDDLIGQGDFQLDEDDINKAKDFYERAIELDSENATGYFKLGLIYYYYELDDKKAIENYTIAINLDPDELLYYVYRGFVYYELGDYDKEIADYTKAISIDSQYTLAYFERGFSYYEQGKYDLAIDDYSEVIRLNPQDTNAYFNRGLAYYDNGEYELADKDYKKAIKDYTEAIKLNNEDANLYYYRGLTYYELGDYERAIADYSEAIKIDPQYTYVYINRGLAYYELGDYELTVDDYTEAIKIDPQNVDAYYYRGLTYYELGEYERAIVDYTEVIKIDPLYANAYFNRSLSYSQLGDDDKAAEDMAKYEELNP